MDDNPYCPEWWDHVWRPYNKVDVYIRFSVCLLGVLTNILNFLVFSRKKMRNPTNLFLLSLAVADFLCVLRKAIDLSRTLYQNSQRGHHHQTPNFYLKTIDDFINSLCFDIFHTWAIYLTLTIAISRYAGVLYPLKSRVWFTSRHAKLAILVSVLVSSCFIPLMYIGVRIDLTYPQQINETNPYYSTLQSVTGQKMKFWVHSLLIKLIPCFILTMTTVGLISSLLRAKKDRTKMMNSAPMTIKRGSQNEEEKIENGVTTTTPKPKSREEERQDAEFRRTTLMLIVMLSVFLFTEFPHGIFTFVMGIVESPDDFFRDCYNPASAFFNLNEYISSAVGFFIYMGMSGNFRATFIQIFSPKPKTCVTKTSINSTTTTTSSIAPNGGETLDESKV